MDKAGKPDKDRGEVLVDIQFTRNNMTASMFDISAAGKSRSRLGKFKDKVRGKKKDGLSETESNVVPSVTQVLTDSEGNSDGEEAVGKDEEKKKKKKVKSLFSHKSNLQKSLSQSMNVLPGKNSSLSGSLSSGLNVESSEGQDLGKLKIRSQTKVYANVCYLSDVGFITINHGVLFGENKISMKKIILCRATIFTIVQTGTLVPQKVS